MAARTTRRKICDQGESIMKDFARMLEHIKFLDELAGGQSEYINTNLPQLYVMIEGCMHVTEKFCDGL